MRLVTHLDNHLLVRSRIQNGGTTTLVNVDRDWVTLLMIGLKYPTSTPHLCLWHQQRG